MLYDDSVSIKQVQRLECHCEKCGHIWVARNEREPYQCPRCLRRDWNKVSQVCTDVPNDTLLFLSDNVAYVIGQMQDRDDHVECRVGDHGLCKKGVE